MKKIITKERRDFTAKYLGDMSKAIWTVGMASQFFVNLRVITRVSIVLLAVIFYAVAVYMIPKGEKHDD